MFLTPYLRNQKALLGQKLQFELSWAEMDQSRYEILKNKTNPEQGHRTGKGVNVEPLEHAQVPFRPLSYPNQYLQNLLEIF